MKQLTSTHREFQLNYDIPTPRVMIELVPYQKLMTYVRACPVEINGFGAVERLGKDFLVTDVFILNQEASPGGVTTDSADLHRYLYELIQQGVEPNKLKLQWHSHVDMAVFPSSIDLATIERYQTDYMISLILNKQGEHYCRLDLYRPFRCGFDIRMKLALPEPTQYLTEGCLEQIRKRVKRRTLRYIFPRVVPPGMDELTSNLTASPDTGTPLDDLVVLEE